MTLLPPIDWREAGIGPDPDLPPERRVTADNWRTWPYMCWAFQHADALVPATRLARAHTPFPLGVRAADLPGRFDWPGFFEATYTDAFVVLHRGAIVFEHYANGMTPDRPHMAFSVTKSIVGLAAERLIARGTIDAGVRVADAVPELAGSGFAPATLRQLLDMTDGVSFDENYADPDAQVHRYSAGYWTPAKGHAGVMGVLPHLRDRFAAPGAAFRYRTPVADVAGRMLCALTGLALPELVAREVWLLAGCGGPAFMLRDTAGVEIAGTGLNATARDLARVALWLMGERTLLAGLTAGGDRALFDAAALPERRGGSYRSFWWIDHAEPATLSANGVFGQRIWIAPAAELAVVRFGSHPVAGNSFTEAAHRQAFAALREALR